MTTISGPIHGGSHGWAFGATTVELEAAGYVEEEYFFEGEAPRYQIIGGYSPDGRWQARASGGSGFKTRGGGATSDRPRSIQRHAPRRMDQRLGRIRYL